MHDTVHAGESRSPEGRRRSRWRIGLTALLAASYMAAEVVGGVLTGSLALLADAGHMLSDVAALGLALGALWLADRPAPPQRTFGWQRMEILAALANGIALVVIAIFVAIEAVERFNDPHTVLGGPMLLVATGGLAVNLAGLAILSGGRGESLNERGAWLHVLSDALGSVGAMAAGFAIWQLGWEWADAAASLLIAALILHASWALLRETVDVLLEAAPTGVDVEELRGAIAGVSGAESVHDLHVWTITSGLVSLSCHVRAAPGTSDDELLARVLAMLRERFHIRHATIQIEPAEFHDAAAQVC